MNTKPGTASLATTRSSDWTRRRFIERVGVGGLGLAFGFHWDVPATSATSHGNATPSLELLESSAFVYVSPLRSDGEESTCHAELWYAWLDDSVVVTVAADRWKARALKKGLDRARVWVGSHGRWKSMLGGRNEDFRKAPNFLASAEKVTDPKTIDRLLDVYGRKYPSEIDRWREAMKKGNADGSRIMIRYSPDPAS